MGNEIDEIPLTHSHWPDLTLASLRQVGWHMACFFLNKVLRAPRGSAAAACHGTVDRLWQDQNVNANDNMVISSGEQPCRGVWSQSHSIRQQVFRGNLKTSLSVNATLIVLEMLIQFVSTTDVPLSIESLEDEESCQIS